MTVQLSQGIKDNLHFLCVEVDSQVANFSAYLSNPTPAIARRVLDRSGYAYNLKMRIHSSCVKSLSEISDDNSSLLILRGAEFVATDLERITELCRECLKQLEYVELIKCLRADDYLPLLLRVRESIALIEQAISENDTHIALEVGQVSKYLDAKCLRLKGKYIDDLKKKENTEDLTRGLFVSENVRHMGETLQHISESIISANLGQPVNFERYFSLQSLVEGLDADNENLQIEPIAETRSGSAISGISETGGKDDEYVAIFKDGLKSKVKEEKQGVKSWHEIYPGLAPKILSYKKRGQSAALLIEHLPGLTFEQVLLNEPAPLLEQALQQLGKTLKSVWQETKTPEPVSAKFIFQLEKRLKEVYKIHPEFSQSDISVCGLNIASFNSLVKRARDYEEAFPSPFSVYIHGDFNVDNIIYDPLEQRINFIDLHRSRYMDYVQDVSVFMVSNYRLQIMDADLRRRIMSLAQDFYRLTKRFAKKHNDDTFELRLALGLARSFATSTRFILDKTLARSMFLRARYLLEMVLATPVDEAKNFSIPLQEIFID